MQANDIEAVPCRGGFAIRRKCGPWSGIYNGRGGFEYLSGFGVGPGDWSLNLFGDKFAQVWPSREAAISDYVCRVLLR